MHIFSLKYNIISKVYVTFVHAVRKEVDFPLISSIIQKLTIKTEVVLNFQT